MISTAFFFYQATRVQGKWQASMFTIGCVTGTAFWHYQFLTEHWSKNGKCPPMYRYIDWFLTVPLQILEFWMILRATVQAGWDMFARLLVLSLLMLISGYAGETQMLNQWAGFMVGLIAWFLIIFEVFAGNAAKDAKLAPLSAQKAFNSLRLIVAVGWSLYPIGYVVGNAGGGDDRIENTLNGIYNVADLVNKTAFGLAIYSAAVAAPVEEAKIAKKLAEIEAVHGPSSGAEKKKDDQSKRDNTGNTTPSSFAQRSSLVGGQFGNQQQLSPRTLRDTNGPQHPRGQMGSPSNFGALPRALSTASIGSCAEPDNEMHGSQGGSSIRGGGNNFDDNMQHNYMQGGNMNAQHRDAADKSQNNGGGGIMGALFGGGGNSQPPTQQSPYQQQQQYGHGAPYGQHPMQQSHPQHFHQSHGGNHNQQGFSQFGGNPQAFSPMARSTSMH